MDECSFHCTIGVWSESGVSVCVVCIAQNVSDSAGGGNASKYSVLE